MKKPGGAEVRGTRALNTPMSFMYASGFWVRRARGVKLGEWILCFLQCFQRCAYLAHQQNLNRFALMPKLHFLHHDSLRLIYAPEDVEWLPNPMSRSVQQQEDYVGRPSRLSRRVAVPLIHRRVMDRSLIASFQAILASDSDQRGLI